MSAPTSLFLVPASPAASQSKYLEEQLTRTLEAVMVAASTYNHLFIGIILGPGEDGFRIVGHVDVNSVKGVMATLAEAVSGGSIVTL